jgi:hypothetical protein
VTRAIGIVAGDVASESAGQAAGTVIQAVEKYFTDHSQTLPIALARANDRAGDGFLQPYGELLRCLAFAGISH